MLIDILAKSEWKATHWKMMLFFRWYSFVAAFHIRKSNRAHPIIKQKNKNCNHCAMMCGAIGFWVRQVDSKCVKKLNRKKEASKGRLPSVTEGAHVENYTLLWIAVDRNMFSVSLRIDCAHMKDIHLLPSLLHFACSQILIKQSETDSG